IDWPLQGEPNLSPKDLAGKTWAQAEKLRLPLYR
ncbi:TPA: dTDP-4-dehydrorhamnose 3,5-epimerase, partial [Neisseria meningitidis]